MSNNHSIHILRGSSVSSTLPDAGQPLYDKSTHLLYIGDGQSSPGDGLQSVRVEKAKEGGSISIQNGGSLAMGASSAIKLNANSIQITTGITSIDAKGSIVVKERGSINVKRDTKIDTSDGVEIGSPIFLNVDIEPAAKLRITSGETHISNQVNIPDVYLPSVIIGGKHLGVVAHYKSDNNEVWISFSSYKSSNILDYLSVNQYTPCSGYMHDSSNDISEMVIMGIKKSEYSSSPSQPLRIIGMDTTVEGTTLKLNTHAEAIIMPHLGDWTNSFTFYQTIS